MRNWRWFAALALLLGLTQSVLAQDYPTHPVRILVQFPPGGVPDLSARLMAEQLSKAFGQSFIVENRPGSGGNRATDVVAKSVPDGYTLLLRLVAARNQSGYLPEVAIRPHQ